MNVIFFIYLISGLIKTVMGFYGLHLPIDITALTAGILVIDIGYNLLQWRAGKKFPVSFVTATITLLILFFWMIFSLIYTPSQVYSKQKIFYFLTNIIAFIYPVVHGKICIRRFMRAFIIGIFLITLWYLPHLLTYIRNPDFHSLERYSEVKGLYLDLGLYIGLSILMLLYNKEFFKPFARISLLFFFVLALFLAGARGALLFTFIIATFLVVIKVVSAFCNNQLLSKQGMIRNSLIGVGVFILVALVSIGYSDQIGGLASRSLNRLNLLVSDENTISNHSVNTRVDQIHFSLDMISADVESFLYGYGVGSFGVLKTGEDVRAYPHNFILEIQFEHGIIGTLLLLIFILLIFIQKGLNVKLQILPAFIFFYFFLNYLKSWSIIDMRICFAFLGLYILQNTIRVEDFIDNSLANNYYE